MEPTSFQAGLEKQNYSVEIQITVHDKLGACTTADPIVIKVSLLTNYQNGNRHH